jgi:hypothetical protein
MADAPSALPVAPTNNPLFVGISDRKASSSPPPSTTVPLSPGSRPADGFCATSVNGQGTLPQRGGPSSSLAGSNLDALSRSAHQLKQARQSDLGFSRTESMQGDTVTFATTAAQALAAVVTTTSSTTNSSTPGDTSPQREDSLMWDKIGVSEHQIVTQQGLASYHSSRSAREGRTSTFRICGSPSCLLSTYCFHCLFQLS